MELDKKQIDSIEIILKKLKECNFKISTDTRKDVSGSVYFALKGDSFDGNLFIKDALKKGAILAVSDNPKNKGKNVIIVPNVLKTLQEVAKSYRQLFNIPIIVIGGSNGKTTSKDLTTKVLEKKYNTHSTAGSFNNHVGVPLSILSMNNKIDIGIFEIGANHPGEHIELLNIVHPTHVVVTNNGMDHLEGFGSPAGVRKANAEIYEWAKLNNAKVFVNKKNIDLMKDSDKNSRIIYSADTLKTSNISPIEIIFDKRKLQTNIVGNYNLENIELALAISKHFKVNKKNAIEAICEYAPSSKRSQFKSINNVNFVIDCYNANPSSMKLSLESFLKSVKKPRGIILGDMLELGKYSDIEHKKIIDYVTKQKIDCVVFIGKNFKKNLSNTKLKYHWFKNSDLAKIWFDKQKFSGFTFLLKGSRGIKVEKIIGLL